MQISFKDPKATLYIVSTPIGNLKDMTIRAIEILKEVDVIYAEDTRTSGVLLSHYDIKTSCLSYHMHNQKERESQIIDRLNQGQNIALISDAGTPGISDPGFEIIDSVIQNGHHVVSIPGVTAAISALTVSGLSMKTFAFIGFLPRKLGDIKKTLAGYQHLDQTLIFYESPQRIMKTLAHIHEAFGNRSIALCRELSKTFETIIRTDLVKALEMTHETRGEYVIVVEGYQDLTNYDEIDITTLVKHFIGQGHDEKEAMKLVAKHKKMSKSDVYKAFKVNHRKT
jgi:16S rRNA (cytidine1402-2'-O)-methyltransferase